MAEHKDRFVQRRAVFGLVGVGPRDPMGEWSRLGLDPSSYLFIADGWKPDPALACRGTTAGIPWTRGCLAMIRNGRRHS